MLDVLAIRSFPGRSLLGKDNLSADLARFSLDTSLAGVDSWRHGPTAPYPSPPMSGSPLQSDLPESQPEERRQAQESRPSPGTQSAQANAPRTDVEAEQIASPPARPPLWTTPRPPASSPSFHRVLSAPVLPGLLADPGSSQGGYTTRHIPSTHRPPFQPRLSPRSPRVPRTTKAHVHSACSNCRAAHLACDVNRPCARCVATGKQNNCVDVPHKRRGRPRIRPLGEPRPEPVVLGFSGQQGLMRPPIVSPRSTQTSIPPPLIPTSYRPLRPFAGELIAPPRGFPAADPTGVAALASTSFESSGTYRPRGGTQPARGLAWALLRTNFVLVKTSPLFRQALGLSGAGMTDTRLTEMLVEHDWNKIERLERIMQEERTFRDPAYLPPIYAGNEAENIQQVGEDELVELTHGSREREEELTFRRPDEQLRTISAQFKLAKKSIYFVVMTLNPEGPLVQSLPEPLSLAYQQGQPSRPAVPFSSYGLPMPPSSYGGPSRPGPPPSRYSDSGSPPYPLSDPSHFAARTPDLHSPRLTRQAFGTFAEEPHPPRDAGSLAVALSWEPRTASSAPSRRASAPHTQHRPQVGEYRPDLQLAPLRARPEPAAQESPSLGVSGTGETRRRRQDDEEESEQESGRQGKRPRMSVKEMLE